VSGPAQDADVGIVGGGVVGLACAAALARAGRSVLLLERRERFAQETSSRNSEVIHAGLYYPEGSLKAELCRAGREALYARCARLGIPHRALGKLVVASDEGEVAALERLRALGEANGAPGLALLDARALAAREPAVRGVAALWSPATGIVDSAELCRSYAAEAEAHGAQLLARAEVVALACTRAGWSVEVVSPDGERSRALCGAVVNAAGLAGDAVAALAGLDVDARGYRIRPCKGDYFALAASAPLSLSTLVYPLPHGAGLGVHATLDLAGRIRFGPDAEYVERVDYAVDPAKAARFAEAARRYLPELRAAWLSPDQAGVRPKLAGPGEGFRDFVVAEESPAGRPGLVSCIGIESPGLTAAGAIAERVVALLR
jgi:L-2-hydroxyglutarate oxidase LhgO